MCTFKCAEPGCDQYVTYEPESVGGSFCKSKILRQPRRKGNFWQNLHYRTQGLRGYHVKKGVLTLNSPSYKRKTEPYRVYLTCAKGHVHGYVIKYAKYGAFNSGSVTGYLLPSKIPGALTPRPGKLRVKGGKKHRNEGLKGRRSKLHGC